jgi:dihydropteroate synthase
MIAAPATRPAWRIARGSLALDLPVVMGILNLTPDSFSDGGDLAGPEAALRRGEAMVREGAAILDVGGESTRPGAAEISEEEELRRVLPTLELLVRELDVPVSVDTRKAGVARRALGAGAAAVNDVSGLRHDPALAGAVARAGAGLVVMHMRGTPADMRERVDYRDLLREVGDELMEGVARARAAGIPDEAVVLDPGLGFAKTPDQSFRLIRDLDRLAALGFPLLVGPSRKSFLGEILPVPPRDRVTGSAVACALAWERGARLFRVHDVREAVDALAVARAVLGGPGGEGSP